ncbi:MAG: sigma-70 family RNA polymerase sigma factor [Bacteroidales bacterium]
MEVNPHLTTKAQRDYQLVQAAIKDGDQKAYAELMKNYKDSLYFMLLKMTNNPADADDLTIEAFGKAFKKLDQYTPNYAFSTWLFKIASNNCIDFMRKKQKATYSINNPSVEEGDGNEMVNILPSEGMDPEENVLKKEKVRRLRDIVEKLKPHYRKLIELRYFKEYSYEEISKELDLPLGTVKAQLYRAREFISNIIKSMPERF